jgi:hypothetical protein
MAFVKSPDGISIELLQKGEPTLEPAEPWASMKTPARGNLFHGKRQIPQFLTASNQRWDQCRISYAARGTAA